MSAPYITRKAEEFPEIWHLSPLLEAFGRHSHIAGGVFRSIFTDTRVKDIDVFFENELAFVSAKNKANMMGLRVISESANIANYHDPITGHTIQLVGENSDEEYAFVFSPPDTRIEVFDFTITKFVLYFDGKNYMVKHHPDYFADLDASRIVIDSHFVNPISTLSRVIRYTDYGYSISPKELADLVIELQKRDYTDEKIYRSLKVPAPAPANPRSAF